jgi:hypothetical protein
MATILGGIVSGVGIFGQYAYAGIGVVVDLAAASGAYVLSAFTLAFACFTGCCTRATTEAIRPITDYEESEAKHGGPLICFFSCTMACCLIFWSAFITTWVVTWVWTVVDPESNATP